MWRTVIKTGIVWAVVLTAAVCAGGCSKKVSNEVERIQASGSFRVAIVDTDSRYTSLEGNRPVGVEPELAEYIGEMLGVQVKYQVCRRDEALQAVADGEADVALGCIHNSGSLADRFLVSTSYGKGYCYGVTRTGDYVLTVGALEDSPLGVAQGLDDEIRSSLYQADGIRITEYDSAADGAEAIKSGVIRAYLCYENQARELLEDEELQVQNLSNLAPEEFVVVAEKSSGTLVSGINTLIRQFLEREQP